MKLNDLIKMLFTLAVERKSSSKKHGQNGQIPFYFKIGGSYFSISKSRTNGENNFSHSLFDYDKKYTRTRKYYDQHSKMYNYCRYTLFLDNKPFIRNLYPSQKICLKNNKLFGSYSNILETFWGDVMYF